MEIYIITNPELGQDCVIKAFTNHDAAVEFCAKHDKVEKWNPQESSLVLHTVSLQDKVDSPEIDNFQVYVDAVKHLSKNKENFTFPNSYPKHAAVVLSEMMNNTKNEFCLFNIEFLDETSNKYDDFYKSIKELPLHCNFKVVIKDEESENAKIFLILKELLEKYPKKVIIKKASTDFINNFETCFKSLTYLAVSDSISYRIGNLENGICNFNDKKRSKKFKGIFDKEFKNCVNYF
jgi:hypothetical protein